MALRGSMPGAACWPRSRRCALKNTHSLTDVSDTAKYKWCMNWQTMGNSGRLTRAKL